MKKNRGEKSPVTTLADVAHLEAIRTELLDAAHALALAINLPTGHARRALVRRAWHAADIADASFTSPAEGVEIDAYEEVAHPTFQHLAPDSKQKRKLEAELAEVTATWDEWADGEMRRTLTRQARSCGICAGDPDGSELMCARHNAVADADLARGGFESAAKALARFVQSDGSDEDALNAARFALVGVIENVLKVPDAQAHGKVEGAVHEIVDTFDQIDEAERMRRAERAVAAYSDPAGKPDKSTTDGGETLHLGGRS